MRGLDDYLHPPDPELSPCCESPVDADGVCSDCEQLVEFDDFREPDAPMSPSEEHFHPGRWG